MRIGSEIITVLKGMNEFIHLVVCLITGPKPLPKRALHIERSRASSFKWQYPLLSLRSSNSFLRLLPRLPVASISPFIFPSITRCRRQFLRKMWPIQLAFHLLISCRIFLCSLTLSNAYLFLTWSVQLIFSILLQHHISKLSRVSTQNFNIACLTWVKCGAEHLKVCRSTATSFVKECGIDSLVIGKNLLIFNTCKLLWGCFVFWILNSIFPQSTSADDYTFLALSHFLLAWRKLHSPPPNLHPPVIK